MTIEVKKNIYSAKKSNCMTIKIRYGEGIKMIICTTKWSTEIDI